MTPTMTQNVGSRGSRGSGAENSAEALPSSRPSGGTPCPGVRGSVGSARPRIDFASVNGAALRALPDLLARWLPDGRATGQEWEARNPRRADRQPGSFRVNMRTGRWADFATGDRGGDPVSLAAFLFGLPQIEAARRLAAMLGLPGGEAHNV